MDNALKTLDTATVCGGRVRVIAETAETNFRALMSEAPTGSASGPAPSTGGGSAAGGAGASEGHGDAGRDRDYRDHADRDHRDARDERDDRDRHPSDLPASS